MFKQGDLVKYIGFAPIAGPISIPDSVGIVLEVMLEAGLRRHITPRTVLKIQWLTPRADPVGVAGGNPSTIFADYVRTIATI